MGILADLAQFLAATGVGVYDPVDGASSTIFTHWMPDVPASALSVALYGSASPGPYTFDAPLPAWESPRVKITARDPSPDAALATCDAAWRALVGVTEITLGGVRYYTIRAVNGPAWNGTEDSQAGTLSLYGCNIQITREIP